MPISMPNIGRRLRILRVEAEITQAQLAELAQITQSLVSRIEKGDADPSLTVIIKLANAFQKESVDEFLFGSPLG